MSSSAISRAPSATKRLFTELQQYQKEPNESIIYLRPIDDDDLTRWSAVIRGVWGTAYEGGAWKIDIHVPSTYPNIAPEMKFVTPICHPNVNFATGEICLDLLKTSWSPIYTLGTTLTSIQQLLTAPEPDSPLNVDIASLMRSGDIVGASSLIVFYTQLYKWTGD